MITMNVPVLRVASETPNNIITIPQTEHNIITINVQVLRVGPLDDKSYFVLRDLQMTSKSDKI